MSTSHIILYACGSDLIADYIEVCKRKEIKIEAIIDNKSVKKDKYDSISPESFDFSKNRVPFIVPLFTPRNRFIATSEAKAKGLQQIAILVADSADIPATFIHGQGCFINRETVVGAECSLGSNVLINRGACIGHHFHCGEYVSIGPGAVISGNVTIESGVMIGAGAVILPSITIGEFAVIGAGSVVTDDVKANNIVVGNPAHKINENDDVFPV